MKKVEENYLGYLFISVSIILFLKKYLEIIYFLKKVFKHLKIETNVKTPVSNITSPKNLANDILEGISINLKIPGKRSRYIFSSDHSNSRMRSKYFYYKNISRSTRLDEIPTFEPMYRYFFRESIYTIEDLGDYIIDNGYTGLLDIYGIGEIYKNRIYSYFQRNVETY